MDADTPARGRTVAPYGSWRSPIAIADVVEDAISLAEPWIDGDDVYWLEGRPTEAGRRVLVRRSADGSTTDLTPPPFNVRTRVHEYGGGSYTAHDGVVVFSNFADGRLYRLGPDDAEPVPITAEGRAWRFADLRLVGDRAAILAVREDHGVDGEPANEIVRLALDGSREPVALVSAPDFVAAPRVSPDGRFFAWLEWDHPDMPWDATRLVIADSSGGGERVTIAGGDGESIVQPTWGSDGRLYFGSDRTGWWNLYRWSRDGGLEPLLRESVEIEFADPAWVFDRSSFVLLEDGAVLAAGRSDGRDRLYRIEPGVGLRLLETPFTEMEGLRVGPAGVVVLGAQPSEATVLAQIDPQTGRVRGVLRRASRAVVPPGCLSEPEAIHFPTADGWTAHALFYRPRNADFEAPAGELPPLVVLSHGGPTSSASTGLDLTTQVLTSRGIAVVDVDYRGSTGYGRAYREALNGRWGIADVEDCIAAARFLAGRGDVDPARMAIAGGSAGGYTTLCALVSSDAFAAGISHFGIADLELLQGDTHKFESRYADGLVAPWPERREVFRERSPIHHLDRLSCPLLVQQGLDDRVVPPSQAEAIVAALRAKGLPYAYVAFEGEGHGFRGRDAIVRSLEADLSFLAQVFGFDLADLIDGVEVVGLRRPA